VAVRENSLIERMTRALSPKVASRKDNLQERALYIPIKEEYSITNLIMQFFARMIISIDLIDLISN